MEFIHEHDAKGHMTINIYPANDDIPPLKAYLEKIKDIPSIDTLFQIQV